MPGAGGIIDSFWISLGVRPDGSGFKEIKKQTESAKQSLLSLGTAVKAALGGFAVKALVDINSAFEQNTIAISGFLEALNFSKAGEGMADAKLAMESIETTAAKLPGEAQEYIEVFRAGLPVLKGAMPGGSLGAMTDFTNRFAAIGKTLQVDAGQIGRDLSLMLGPTGRAGAQVLTFQRMLPFIQQLKGHAHDTAESFNAMTQPQRLALLQDTLANPRLSEMLDRSANSWDAMWGAARSGLNKFIREASVELFPGLKAGLEKLTAMFIDGKGKLTPFGHQVVDVAKKIGAFVMQTGEMVAGLISLASESTAGKLALVGLAAGLIGVKKVLRGGLITAIVMIAEDIYTFLTGGESVTGMLLDKFPVATKAAIFALGLLGVAFTALKLKELVNQLRDAGGVMKSFSGIAGPLGLIGALTTVYALLEKIDEKLGITEKIQKAFGVEERAPTTGSFATRSFEPIKDFKARLGVTGIDPKTGQAKFSKVAPAMQTWNPSMSFAPSSGDGVLAPQAAGTSITLTGDVNIKSDNPRDAGRAFMNTIRDAQSKVSH